jgi:hypothetical protein
MPASMKNRIDAMLARVCANCTACRGARKKQRGFAFWFVKRVEGRLCPFCRAYERVHGRKAHEAPAQDQSPPKAGTPAP